MTWSFAQGNDSGPRTLVFLLYDEQEHQSAKTGPAVESSAAAAGKPPSWCQGWLWCQ